MKKSELKQLAGKIGLALEFSSQRMEASDLAFYLANIIQTEVVGMFFDSDDLLLSAQYPFAREIIAGSAHERSITMDNMEQSLRAWATQLQRQISAQASKENIPCSFQHIKQKLPLSLLALTSTFKMTIFPGLRAPLYTTLHYSHTVCVLIDDNCDAQSATNLLQQCLSDRLNHVLFIDSGKDKSADIIRDMNNAIGVANPSVKLYYQIRKLSDPHQLATALAQILRTINREHPTSFVLLASGHQLLSDANEFIALQQQLSCPLIVAG